MIRNFHLLVLIILPACSVSPTSESFRKSNGPAISELGLQQVSTSEVILKYIPSSIATNDRLFEKWMNGNKTDRNLLHLGNSIYKREGRTSEHEIRQAASKLGAKVAYVYMPYSGRGKKTISVPIAHTDGQTITSNSYASGSISAAGMTSGTIGSTPFSSNTHMQGSYSGSNTTSTYIPGTTTYAAREVAFDCYDVLVMFYVPIEHVSKSGMAKLSESTRELDRY
jgi:hypothetical protein